MNTSRPPHQVKPLLLRVIRAAEILARAQVTTSTAQNDDKKHNRRVLQ